MNNDGRNSETVYLIDANALLFQVFHAIGPMSSPKGLPTNALFGFTRYMFTLHEEKRPDYLICAFDPDGPVFRNELYSEYKSNRDEMPNDLALQLGPIRELLGLMNVPIVCVDGFEADDVMATLATEAEKRGKTTFLCTSDKDCRQLISESVSIYNLRKNRIIDEQVLWEEWGVTPTQVIDLQTLVGDSVDNIKGVPGVGIKTAAKLLQEYQTLDNLLAHVDQVSGKKRQENLKASVPFLDHTRTLVTLRRDVPLKLEWEKWRLQPWDKNGLLEKFETWGFRRFADQMRTELGKGPEVSNSRRKKTANPPPLPLFDDLGSEDNSNGSGISEVESKRGTYHLVDDETKWNTFLKELQQQSRFAVDLETTGLEIHDARIVGYAITWKAGKGWYIPVRAPKGNKVLDAEMVKSGLKPIFEDAKVAKINQNIKYEISVLRQHGIELVNSVGDSMIADYLLNPGAANHNLEYLAKTYLKYHAVPITDLIGPNGPKQLRMDEVDTKKVADYAAEDADLAWQLCQLLESQLNKAGLESLYHHVEMPLVDVLASMETIGIRLNGRQLEKLSQQLASELHDLEEKIYHVAGEQFHIASLKQLRRILFEKLKLPVKRKTGITGVPSTDEETLEWLAARKTDNELPRYLLEHRKVSKLKSTYVDALPKQVHAKTGRIHARFNQTVTTTGRLSSSEPNLQNIPIRNEKGGQIRQAFIPEEGWTLITADYSQIELRMLAQLSGDAALRRAFEENRDIHSSVAAQIYAVSDDEVTKTMRRMAKTVNFGVIYGMSAFGLSQRLQIPQEEAETFITTYFEKFPKVLEYQDQLLNRCRKQGYVSTILGRRRYFHKNVIRENSTYKQRNQPEREAINMEIQGSAADLIKVAMLNVFRKLKAEKMQSVLLLQIHDELVLESPPEEINTCAKLLVSEMTQALSNELHIPLRVVISAGKNWLDVEPLKL